VTEVPRPQHSRPARPRSGYAYRAPREGAHGSTTTRIRGSRVRPAQPSARALLSDQFGLVEVVDRLRHGIVKTVADRPGRGHCSEFRNAIRIDHDGGVIRPVIGVMDQPIEPAARLPRSHIECLHRQNLRFQRRSDIPAHDSARVHVSDERDIGEPRPGGDVGHVAHPELARPVSGESPVDEIGRQCRRFVGACGEHAL
jgi:hypothetical protein